MALCSNQWFEEKVKSDLNSTTLECTSEPPPPPRNTLEEDLKTFSINEDIIDEIVEEAMRTNEEIEKENVLFIKI